MTSRVFLTIKGSSHRVHVMCLNLLYFVHKTYVTYMAGLTCLQTFFKKTFDVKPLVQLSSSVHTEHTLDGSFISFFIYITQPWRNPHLTNQPQVFFMPISLCSFD